MLFRSVRRALWQALLDRVLGLDRRELAHRDDDRHDLPRELARGREAECLAGAGAEDRAVSVSVRGSTRTAGGEPLTCGLLIEKSTRLSMVRTNAAVFPVPDCDCPIMFCGLKESEFP